MNLTIAEVKETLQTIEHPSDPFLLACRADERKGVQQALSQWQKQYAQKQALVQQYRKKNQLEETAYASGYRLVAGIDEVGRGPLAGPVVAAAVVLDRKRPIIGLEDSKKLSSRKRQVLFLEIEEKALAVGVGILSAAVIDQSNILEATKLAMQEAVLNLSRPPDLLLVDAVVLPGDIPQKKIIQGDTKSNSIAAASIVAKVTRDQIMRDYDEKYPGYGFAKNAGYGTREHLEGLKLWGATAIHRQSFSPVKKYR